jgi:predicted transcriptional regulator
MENQTINDRIVMLIKHYGLNVNSFSIRIGLTTNTTLGKIVNSKDRQPSYPTIVAILQAFPKLSCEWLLMGTGSMFSSGDDNIPEASDRVAHIIKKKEMTTRSFCISAKISETEMSEVITGKKEPGTHMMAMIASAFPEIDPAWLFSNEGEMFR